MTDMAPRLREVLRDIVCHPVRHFVERWNWKSAALSSIGRAIIFLVANLPAGAGAGLRAMLTEFVFRGVMSGVLGSITQALGTARSTRSAMLTAVVALPALGHTVEYVVHRAAGTPRLHQSIAASIAFSILTTAFNFFAMRRGALIVGNGQQSLGADLQRMPRLIGAFIKAGALGAVPRRRSSPHRSTGGATCPSHRCT
jgi:hypothetical protein